ncbi:oxalurate catabolism protein HpxZ [Phytopseudomonas dryadis]|uniref:Oxalurate catabolism protein HpxZ n=1 Tax=Phytopseudomonas dryadis TaxID=2487520 RepID=A0ABY1ZBM5_9GAMM|nr:MULTISPECIES: oxalurate catabolism protein HpxZ [Pseudomonas]TBV09429.1 oxalurate catabolism protein HpxZ [Pseudomonas dryadis]TBV18817.1 oxalurate catabolism protein HpxZ [Pseudomonas sp. FRB 230]
MTDLAASDLQTALEKLYAVRPVWRRVVAAADAIGLPGRTLLHAGPPFRHGQRPSAPILSSAVLCCLYEGWADSEAAAQYLITSGEVRLRPAQDFNVVTPLAAVVSPGTTLVEVVDAAGINPRPCWSLLSSGRGPQIRFGTRQQAVIERLAWRDGELARVLRTALAEGPIDLLPLAVAGLQRGDDLHSVTSGASQALQERLMPLLEGADEVERMLDETPLFFLTLWMAACHLLLDTLCDEPAARSLLVALAGNGIEAGIRLAGDPARWRTAAAHTPQGPRLKAGDEPVCPMLGDSGVIDAAGFGAQAWHHATGAAADMAGWLPGRPAAAPEWRLGQHPLFAPFGLGSAIDSERIDHHSSLPRVAIAMLDARGEAGLLGRGVCQTPARLYGSPAADEPELNDPLVVTQVNAAFERYEQALVSNDVATLDELFWRSPHTVRYGATENLYGSAAIRAFRDGRPATGLARRIIERSITSFGSDHAVTHMAFSREGNPRTGRQTQTWVRIAGAWRIVSAHVSNMD